MAETFPKTSSVTRPNVLKNINIVGRGNNVSPSADNVNVNGDRNAIGDECKDIQIFSSSGCVVFGGIKNITIINSSGVTASTDDQVWINNYLYPPIKGGVKVTKVITQYAMLATDEFMECNASTSSYTLLLIPATSSDAYSGGYGKIINIKKTDSSSNIITIGTAGNGNIDDQATIILSTQYESVTLISNGTNYYII